jgi:hypothetical protein
VDDGPPLHQLRRAPHATRASRHDRALQLLSDGTPPLQPQVAVAATATSAVGLVVVGAAILLGVVAAELRVDQYSVDVRVMTSIAQHVPKERWKQMGIKPPMDQAAWQKVVTTLDACGRR